MGTSRQSGAPSEASTARLNSWKEIAVFFDKDVRTVRRWEAMRGLPVRRMPGGGRSGVFAYVAELEQWLAEAGRDDLETVPSSIELPDALEDQPEHFQPELTWAAPPNPAPDQPPEAVAPEPSLQAAASAPGPSMLRRHVFTAFGIMTFLAAGLAILALRGRTPPSNFGTTVAGEERPGAPSANPEAQELYLRGKYLWNQRTEPSLTAAVDLFMQAIVHDPHFAAAYAGLADSYVLLRQYGHMPDGEAFPRALAASRQALALDDSSPQAHRAYAFILNYWMWNFPEAEREFQRAIQLNPADAQTHSWYATSLNSVGRYQDAVREIDIARRLQPDSIVILANRGLLLAAVDRNAARAYMLELERVNPDFPNVHTYLSGIYLEQEDYANYLAEARKAASERGDASEIALLDRAQRELAAHGPNAMLRLQAEGYGKQVDAGRSVAMQPASLYAKVGNKERALHYLTLACNRHESSFPLIDRDEIYRPLYAMPQFEALKRRVVPMSLEDALKTTDRT